MKPRWQSVITSLVVPVVMVLSGVLLLGPSSYTVFGIPALFVFVFIMFPVATVLMWVSWRTWDRHGADAFEREWSGQDVSTDERSEH